jgi:hypothetical protein
MNTYQQRMNAWAHATFGAMERDMTKIHHFNMRAMEKYEEWMFQLLEFDNDWSTEDSGIPPPRRLADIAYLREAKYEETRSQVSRYLMQFRSFTEYFNDLDALLDAMRQWSTFFHDNHPQPEDMTEMFIKIGKRMTDLNLGALHAEVMEVRYWELECHHRASIKEWELMCQLRTEEEEEEEEEEE